MQETGWRVMVLTGIYKTETSFLRFLCTSPKGCLFIYAAIEIPRFAHFDYLYLNRFPKSVPAVVKLSALTFLFGFFFHFYFFL
jgi:hypothetical protein